MIKEHWFKILVAAAVVGLIVFLSIPNDNIKRSELIELELQIRKEAFDGLQFVIDTLENNLSKTEEKIVSLQKAFGETKKNIKHLSIEVVDANKKFKQLKNDVSKIDYSDSSVAAILQRIRAGH